MIMHQLQNFDKHIYIFICKMTKGKNEPSTYDMMLVFLVDGDYQFKKRSRRHHQATEHS